MAQIIQTKLESIYQFENPRVLTNLEAAKFLASRDNNPTDQNSQNDVFRQQLLDKAKEYAEQFQQYSDENQLNAAHDRIKDLLEQDDNDDDRPPRTEREQLQLDNQIEYEIAMLLNLCPVTADEAISYVPTLTRKSSYQINEIIEALAAFR